MHSRLLKHSSDRPSLLSQSCCAPRGFCGLAHAHCDKKWPPLTGSARKECSPQGNSQAQRQTTKTIPSRRANSQQGNLFFCNSEKFDHGTVGKANCCCHDKVPPIVWSHIHATADTRSQTTGTTTMIFTITMSIRHPLPQLFCSSTQSMEGFCGKLRVVCG